MLNHLVRRSRSARQRPGRMTRSAPSGGFKRRVMISSVIRAATFTPTSKTDHSNPRSLAPTSTVSSLARARWPVRNRMRSAIGLDFTLAAGEAVSQFVKGFDHERRLERLQPCGVFQINFARINLDHALGRFGFQFR